MHSEAKASTEHISIQTADGGTMTKPEIHIKEAVEIYGDAQTAERYRYVARG